MDNNTMRSRKGAAPISAPAVSSDDKTRRNPSKKSDDKPESSSISFLDVIRVITGLLLLSGAASWFVTDGDSLLWGFKPQVARWRTWKAMLQPELVFTDTELVQYDGTNPEKPIYVAVNGSVFDVSANPGMYGPGGGYGFFSGRDAARAFVSGCFAEDLTWDLRGLEEMFINGEARKEDDAEAAEIYDLAHHINTGELSEKYGKIHPEGRLRWLKRQREKRRAEALERVEKQIRHWDNFFRNHDKYFYVGKVIHPSLEGQPVRQLCTSQGKPKKN